MKTFPGKSRSMKISHALHDVSRTVKGHEANRRAK
ncbi:hypothetical protein BVRB_2g033940 [Beta vulgaris subsp. vulgaris]|nr:hypothetical protein BVRB_2g033940 [Beta vulgaris subsp. vulgaris]